MNTILKLGAAVIVLTAVQLPGQTIPNYRPQSESFQVPIEMRGVAADSGSMRGDYYAYQYQGMFFGMTGERMPSNALGFEGDADLSNPFGLIATFWYGYQTANVDVLRNLLTEEGLAQLDAANYFDNFSEKSAVVSDVDSIWFLAAMEMGDGMMVFTRTRKIGIERNYLEKIGDRYYIVPLANRSYDALIQNFILYLFYDPQPYQRPLRINYADSVNISVKTDITARVSEPGKYVVMARAGAEKPIFANVQDNGGVDRDEAPQEVQFPITLSYFLPKGENEVYVVESNFPVMFVTQTLLDNALRVRIKVK